ncbi:MAG: bifunctional hydroxymethylpyrimidine kinase/phosphomethylpyrimidine kinase [Thermoanaerobaculia bacterium]
MHKALTIAGSDSGGGAGIQADLKTFMAHGVYGASVITGVTAQNTRGVRAVQLIDPVLVAAQIDAVLEDIGADAVKTGMLGSREIIETVAARLAAHRVEKLVVDPVMVAKSGDRLLREDAVTALREKLLPMALVVTPNLPEASDILGWEIASEKEMEAAARDIHALGPRYVLLKGGHLAGDPVDILYDGTNVARLASERIDTPPTHGTGCTYAAAIAANLALGLEVEDAVRKARAYLIEAIAAAARIGHGQSPVNHLVRGLPRR